MYCCAAGIYIYTLLNANVYAPVTTGTPVYDEQWNWYFNNCCKDDVDLIVENDDVDQERLMGLLREYYSFEQVPIDSTITLFHLIRK